MVRQVAQSRFFLIVRSFVMLGTLCALCVSDGVGPHLLPLPFTESHHESRSLPSAHAVIDTVTSLRGQGNCPLVLHVYIVSPETRRLFDDQRVQSSAVIKPIWVWQTTLVAAGRTFYDQPPSLYSYLFFLRPPGRSPPFSAHKSNSRLSNPSSLTLALEV
jgi:hypothetical protein